MPSMASETPRTRVAPAEARVGLGARVQEVVDAVEDGEGAADAEEQQRDDERPEVALARPAEGEALVRGLDRQVHADEEERLVARVGERVHGLGERGRRVGEERRRELARGDGDVAGERGEDDLAAVGAGP